MKLKVNGKDTETRSETVMDLIRELGYDEDGDGMAVAVNDSVLQRKQWNSFELSEQDRVEIIRATQGG